MNGDWLDRAALAAGRPVTRRSILRLAVGSALGMGPLAELIRAGAASGAPGQAVDQGDCVDCTLTADAQHADDARYCAGVIAKAVTLGPALPGGGAIGMGGAAGCLGLVFGNWYHGYDHCRTACASQPRRNERPPSSGNPSWVPPRAKASPVEPPPPPPKKKKPSKRKPKPGTKPPPPPPPPPPPQPPCDPNCPACCPSSTSSNGWACCNCCDPGGDGCKAICG